MQAINSPCDVLPEVMPPLKDVNASDAMKKSLSQLLEKADEVKAPVIVMWCYESDAQHYSVFTPKVHYWSYISNISDCLR